MVPVGSTLTNPAKSGGGTIIAVGSVPVTWIDFNVCVRRMDGMDRLVNVGHRPTSLEGSFTYPNCLADVSPPPNPGSP